MLQDIATIETKYRLFIERTAATKLVWGLMSKQGWANSHSNHDEDVMVVPFWSDRAYAKACARDEWKQFTPESIHLADFLENWCPGMAEEGNLVGANWDANLFGKESGALDVALDILNKIKEMNSTIALRNYSNIDELIADINQAADQ